MVSMLYAPASDVKKVSQDTKKAAVRASTFVLSVDDDSADVV
jgi:hypothetical protein